VIAAVYNAPWFAVTTVYPTVWAVSTRAYRDRGCLRYARGTTDEEWESIKPFMPPPTDRRVISGIVHVL